MTLEVILAQAAEKRHAHRGATPAGALCDMAAEPQGRGTARRARACRVGLLMGQGVHKAECTKRLADRREGSF